MINNGFGVIVESCEKPTKENVSVRDILVQKIEGKARYLNIVDKTDYSIIAFSQDQNFKCFCPFGHFSDIIVVKENDSILVGDNVDKTLLEEVVEEIKIKKLVKRAYSERDLVANGSGPYTN